MTQFSEKFIAYVDVLGFKSLVAAAEDGSGLGSVLNSVFEAVARLFHGGGRRLRRTTDAVGKSVVKHITFAAA